jgi:hypothetical protein
MNRAALLALAMLALAGTPLLADDQVPGSPAYRAFYGAFLPPT